MSLLRSALLASAVVFASAGSAFAGTYTVSTSFGPSITDFTAPLTLATFDSAGHNNGTLTGVTLTLSTFGNFGGTVTNTANDTQSFSVTETVNLSLTNASGTSIAGLTALKNVLTQDQDYTLAGTNGVPGSGGSDTFGPYNPTNSKSISPSSLSPFVTGPLNFTLTTVTGQTILGGGGNITAALTTTAGGTLSAIYTYSEPPPVGVPEPASMALLGAGLLSVGLIRRKRG